MADWDATLLAVDFSQNNWRDYNWDVVPMNTLRSLTLSKLSRQCSTFDTNNGRGPELNPPDWERFRRLNEMDPLQMRSPAQVDRTILSLFLPNEDTVDNLADRIEDPGKAVDEGSITVAFELELAVAVAANSEKEKFFPDDPHPNDKRWQIQEIIPNDKWADLRYKEATVRRFAEVLNSETDLIVIPKAENEDDPGYQLKLGQLKRLEAGLDPRQVDNPEYTPTRPPPPLSDQAQKVATQAALFATNYFGDDKPMQLATDDDLDRIVQKLPMLAQWGVITTREGDLIYERLRLLLRLARLKASRDPRHVDLPGMKDRYKCTSVYTMQHLDLSVVTRENYPDTQQAASNPVEGYRWEIVKISSPVLRPDPRENLNFLTQLCTALRRNFRIHRDMWTIPVTTQAVVSHTSGFSLLDLKKFVVLWSMIHGDLSKLCRSHRSSNAYENVCGMFTRRSPLLALCETPAPLADLFLGNEVVPRPSDETRNFMTDQMNQHIPTEGYWDQMDPASQKFITGLWLFTKVDDLSKAVNAPQRAQPLARSDIVIKCAGDGPRTAADDDDDEHEEVLLPGRVGRRPVAFREVDPHRGVVEFRKCHGVLDPEHVVFWLYLNVFVVRAVRESDPLRFRSLLRDIVGRRAALLTCLGVPQDIQNFFVNHIHSDGGYFEPDDPQVLWSDPFYPPLPSADQAGGG
ncbi:hypothetical protein F4779DRAFT_618732 [Xylariaceae sp. FL0662B]|nr:hypothetical protein F4779DRAFT_618732 [Xylariaceae sp. FL0662B]